MRRLRQGFNEAHLAFLFGTSVNQQSAGFLFPGLTLCIFVLAL